jgi:beta-phosphoglucomutase-like phosphatase (HAD superfamily)
VYRFHFSVYACAKIAPAEIVAIGDEVRDIEAARNVGIACGSVAWGYAAPKALRARNPDLLFEHMEDIARDLLGPHFPIAASTNPLGSSKNSQRLVVIGLPDGYYPLQAASAGLTRRAISAPFSRSTTPMSYWPCRSSQNCALLPK